MANKKNFDSAEALKNMDMIIQDMKNNKPKPKPKAEKKDPDPDNPSNAWAYYYMLYFGEERKGVEVDKKEFERAQPGMAYYVAFYSESDLAFSCFDVERYEPDPAMLR